MRYPSHGKPGGPHSLSRFRAVERILPCQESNLCHLSLYRDIPSPDVYIWYVNLKQVFGHTMRMAG
jgi:hypothetical protein